MIKLLAGGLVAVIVGGFAIAGVMAMLMVTAAEDAARLDCPPGTVAPAAGGWAGTVPAGAAADGLGQTQLTHAATIVAVGEGLRVPRQGIVVALATAAQESGFRNYANDGRGDDLQPDQRDVSASLRLPHDAVGTDHGSVGLFQQQYPWWGTLAELMDPATSAALFYQALLKVPGWQDLPVTVAAQRVQRSAFPSAYAAHEPLARQLVEMLAGTTDTPTPAFVQAGLASGQMACGLGSADGLIMAGGLVFPLPAGSFTVGSGFGWRDNPTGAGADNHTGLDFAAPAGTPVYALADGVVSTAMTASVSYGNRVILEHSDTMQTLYAHLSVIEVVEGQAVTAGQRIGQVGSTGRSTGNHLHFEIRQSGNPVDPLTWLRQAGLDPTSPAMPQHVAGPSSSSGASVRMVTYNVHYGRSPAAVAAEIRAVIDRSKASILCLQEATVARKIAVPAGWRLIQPRVSRDRGTIGTATPLLVDARVWAVHGVAVTNLTMETFVGEAGAGPAVASRRDLVLAQLSGPGGALTVGCTHFTASKEINAVRGRLWGTQASKVADTLAALRGRVLIGGDFNATPSSIWMRPIAAVATVSADPDPKSSRGRIDHVWGRLLHPHSSQLMPRMGSDHRPVLTVWTPAQRART